MLIHCAGVGFPQGSGATPDERAQAVIDINLVGPWRVTSAALPALLESRGRVVNVSSGLAFLTLPFATAYTMSKRGLPRRLFDLALLRRLGRAARQGAFAASPDGAALAGRLAG